MTAQQQLVIISVAHRPVLPVWKFTSRLLEVRFPGAKKVVIVPFRDLELFRRATGEGISVVSEDDVMESWAETFESASKAGLPDRKGWYLQQLLKIQALIDYSDSAHLLIWDADTLPLREIDFFGTGIPQYFLGTEHNKKYFETIANLLGSSDFYNASFIAQCFPILGSQVKGFVEHLGARHGLGAIEAIISSIDFSHPASFSEYETLGTFVASQGGGIEQPGFGRWSRNGWRRIGSPWLAHNLYKTSEHPELAFVAFERKPLRYRVRSFVRGAMRQLGAKRARKHFI